MREAKKIEKSKKKKEADDEDGRHPLAFTPGTNEKRRTEGSPRRTSLHRRTEGHGVYFCRVAAVVAGQKACGFHPEPRVSLSASPPPLSLSFPSLQPLYPAFPSSSHAFVRPSSPSSFLPFRHGSLALFFSSRYASFYATAQPRSSLSRARFPLYSTRAISPSLSPFLPLPLSCSRTSTTSVVFSPILPVSLFLFNVQTDRARERANEKIRTT